MCESEKPSFYSFDVLAGDEVPFSQGTYSFRCLDRVPPIGSPLPAHFGNLIVEAMRQLDLLDEKGLQSLADLKLNITKVCCLAYGLKDGGGGGVELYVNARLEPEVYDIQ